MSITFTTWDILREFYHTDISKGVPGNPESDKMYYKDNQFFWLHIGFYFQIHRNNSLSRLESDSFPACASLYFVMSPDVRHTDFLYNQIDSLFDVFSDLTFF